MAKSEWYSSWAARVKRKTRRNVHFHFFDLSHNLWYACWHTDKNTLTLRRRASRVFLAITSIEILSAARALADQFTRRIEDYPPRTSNGIRSHRHILPQAIPPKGILDSLDRIANSRTLQEPNTPLQIAEAQAEAAGAIFRTTAPKERRRRKPTKPFAHHPQPPQ